MDQAGQSGERMAGRLEGAGKKANTLGDTMRAVGKRVAVATATGFAVTKIADFGGSMLRTAGEVQGAQRQVTVVFGEQEDVIRGWASENAASVGPDRERTGGRHGRRAADWPDGPDYRQGVTGQLRSAWAPVH